VVLVDEAYIHFRMMTALDLVKADKDVVVLRTFSKIYGMAGLRCGMAIGRPDLIEKWHLQRMEQFAGDRGGRGIEQPGRRERGARAQANHCSGTHETFAWMDSKGYSYIRRFPIASWWIQASDKTNH